MLSGHDEIFLLTILKLKEENTMFDKKIKEIKMHSESTRAVNQHRERR